MGGEANYIQGSEGSVELWVAFFAPCLKQHQNIANKNIYTIWGVSQLSAHHTGISVVPEVITDGAPSVVNTHLHPPFLFTFTARKSNFSIGTGHFK